MVHNTKNNPLINIVFNGLFVYVCTRLFYECVQCRYIDAHFVFPNRKVVYENVL